jgi:hypothetical protein
LPQAWIVPMDTFLPESGAWQSAVQLKAVCQGVIPVVANRCTGAWNVSIG